ncbi:hypothetical protein [Methylocystis echinoides]|uniref:Uncharacterized protein n=1 Tax=Methylocystis echinoides TaxID=29468 RepID=A0A9W6GV23_9HYPH|nr:hypothetical protein [Methylocystis echinoides]GLI93597.1 hypothetical protein LMG27198_25890 [Methylocystis echinoides]
MSKPLSLGEFAARALGMEADIHAAMEAAIEKGCKRVQRKAKQLIGVEQPEWPALAPATIADKQRQGYRVPAPLLRTGKMRDTIEWQAPFWNGPREVSGYVGTSFPIAVYQELGTMHIPPRPFLSLAAMGLEPHLQEMMGAMVTAAMIHGGHNVELWKKAFEYLHKAGEQARELFEEEAEGD